MTSTGTGSGRMPGKGDRKIVIVSEVNVDDDDDSALILCGLVCGGAAAATALRVAYFVVLGKPH